MRSIVLQMMTTLNGRLDDPDAWVSGIPDDLYTEIDRIHETYDTILVGQATYDEMFEYWPQADGSETVRSMAHKMNTYKKFVFSGDKRALTWNNARQVLARSDDDIIRFIRDLKAQPGADIHLSGGLRLAQSFVRLGLVDEYRFFVYPVVSSGAGWFDPITGSAGLELVSATAYENGIVGLHYKAKRI